MKAQFVTNILECDLRHQVFTRKFIQFSIVQKLII